MLILNWCKSYTCEIHATDKKEYPLHATHYFCLVFYNFHCFYDRIIRQFQQVNP